MKVAGIILIVLQVLGILFGIVDGSIADVFYRVITGGVSGIAYGVGYLLLGIVGVILLVKGIRKERAKKDAENVLNRLDANSWRCACGHQNVSVAVFCAQCGTPKPSAAPIVEEKHDIVQKEAVKPDVPKQEEEDHYTIPFDENIPAGPVTPVVPVQPVQPVRPVQPVQRSVIISIARGPMAGTKFRCRPGMKIVAGRDPSRCNLKLTQYAAVSGAHCRIEILEQGIAVVDLQSTNGTFLNSRRIVSGQPVPVRSGDVICLGTADCAITFQYE